MVCYLLFWLSLKIGAEGASWTQDLASSLVFDAVFYLNNNPDLEDAGILTAKQARENWLHSGVKEGLQATSMFHSKQYLDRYQDLKEKFGDDYEAATLHYLTIGISQKRVGYLEEGGYGRFTIHNPVSGIYVSSSKRCAGAVDSVVWNNKEFINSFDHGRQLQVALTTPPYGECWNPTEAGGNTNDKGFTTDSVLINMNLQGNVLSTTNNPAYWYRPGQRVGRTSGSKCTAGSEALNTRNPHPFPLSKQVRIGALGMDNCIEFLTSIDIGDQQPPNYDYIRTEGPTGYLMSDFSNVYNINPDTGAIYNYTNGTQPIALATTMNDYAMGVYTDVKLPYLSKYGMSGVYYKYYSYPGIGPFPDLPYKWTLLFREEPQPAGTVLNYRAYICIGTLKDVALCIKKAKKVSVENSLSVSSADEPNSDFQIL